VKYFDNFVIILTADFNLVGENRTNGKVIRYNAISMYARGKIFEAYF